MAANSFHFELSYDEIAWLLDVLHIPPLVGMAGKLFPDSVDEAAAQTRKQAGASALHARGLVNLTDDQKIQIDPLLTGTLGAVALAEAIWIITTVRQERGQNWTCYLGESLLVEHQIAGGLHHFTVTNLVSDLVARVLEHLGVDNPPQSAIPYSDVAPETMRSVIEAISRQDADGAYQILVNNGFDSASSEQFVLTVRDSEVTSLMIFLEPTGDGENRQLTTSHTLSIYRSPENIIRVDTAFDSNSSPQSVQVKPVVPGDLEADLTQHTPSGLTNRQRN